MNSVRGAMVLAKTEQERSSVGQQTLRLNLMSSLESFLSFCIRVRITPNLNNLLLYFGYPALT